MSEIVSNPNILITGTPGVGKSRLCRELAKKTGLLWQDVSTIVKENKFLSEYDEKYKCYELDEDKLLDYLENVMSEGGNIVDYHGCEFFPERWFDVVFVLRTDNTILYDRLISRGYSGKKLEDNVQCEIFQTILEEAKNSYAPEIVHCLQSNTDEQMEDNVKQIINWIKQWKLTKMK